MPKHANHLKNAHIYAERGAARKGLQKKPFRLDHCVYFLNESHRFSVRQKGELLAHMKAKSR